MCSRLGVSPCRANFWVERILHLSRPPGLVVSRKSLERKDAIEDRDWGLEIVQGCMERGQFPLRAYTIVHRDLCRPEVAIA